VPGAQQIEDVQPALRDDTGGRHAAKYGFCTQIGDDRFTWFGTRASKSRVKSSICCVLGTPTTC